MKITVNVNEENNKKIEFVPTEVIDKGPTPVDIKYVISNFNIKDDQINVVKDKSLEYHFQEDFENFYINEEYTLIIDSEGDFTISPSSNFDITKQSPNTFKIKVKDELIPSNAQQVLNTDIIGEGFSPSALVKKFLPLGDLDITLTPENNSDVETGYVLNINTPLDYVKENKGSVELVSGVAQKASDDVYNLSVTSKGDYVLNLTYRGYKTITKNLTFLGLMELTELLENGKDQPVYVNDHIYLQVTKKDNDNTNPITFESSSNAEVKKIDIYHEVTPSSSGEVTVTFKSERYKDLVYTKSILDLLDYNTEVINNNTTIDNGDIIINITGCDVSIIATVDDVVGKPTVTVENDPEKIQQGMNKITIHGVKDGNFNLTIKPARKYIQKQLEVVFSPKDTLTYTREPNEDYYFTNEYVALTIKGTDKPYQASITSGEHGRVTQDEEDINKYYVYTEEDLSETYNVSFSGVGINTLEIIGLEFRQLVDLNYEILNPKTEYYPGEVIKFRVTGIKYDLPYTLVSNNESIILTPKGDNVYEVTSSVSGTGDIVVQATRGIKSKVLLEATFGEIITPIIECDQDVTYESMSLGFRITNLEGREYEISHNGGDSTSISTVDRVNYSIKSTEAKIVTITISGRGIKTTTKDFTFRAKDSVYIEITPKQQKYYPSDVITITLKGTNNDALIQAQYADGTTLEPTEIGKNQWTITPGKVGTVNLTVSGVGFNPVNQTITISELHTLTYDLRYESISYPYFYVNEEPVLIVFGAAEEPLNYVPLDSEGIQTEDIQIVPSPNTPNNVNIKCLTKQFKGSIKVAGRGYNELIVPIEFKMLSPLEVTFNPPTKIGFIMNGTNENGISLMVANANDKEIITLDNPNFHIRKM